MPKIRKNLVLLFTFVLLFTSIHGVSTVAYGEEETGSWETKASMSTARGALGVAAVNGKIYAIGGYDGSQSLNLVEEYNPTTDTWTTKSSMPTTRHNLGVVAVNGKIYAIGGGTNEVYASNVVEEYDPATDTWTTRESMPVPRRALSVVAVNGKIYAIGGYNKTGNLKTLEVYDPTTDTWTEKASAMTPGQFISVSEVNGKIYAIGGSHRGYFLVEEYDLATDTWTIKESTSMARFAAGAVTYNEKIYVVGGGRVNDKSKNVEVYNPATNSWSTEKEIITGRYALAAAELNGSIYVIGGVHANEDTAIVEAYTIPQTSPPAPLNLTATGGDSKVTLNWNAVEDCDGYKVYRSTTSGEPYDLIESDVTTSSYIDLDVNNGTTYYYVVTAVNSNGESDYSNEASATPHADEQPTGDRALLVITMQNGLEKEYDMSMTEVEEFMEWCNSDNAEPYYTIDKDYNVGPFTSRKDYIAHDKIMCFEVNEY